MFDRFRSAFQLTSRTQEVRGNSYVPELADVNAFMDEFAGSAFSEGLYRVHTLPGAVRWTEKVGDAFPSLKGNVWAFGFDWLGRHFALSWKHLQGQELGLVMAEPGTGDVLVIPATFASFHDGTLIDQTEEALAKQFFVEWRSSAKGRVINASECVGYQVPLFLGGRDNVENLEVQDAAVYLDICGQLWSQVKGLPPGSKISGITVDGKRPS